MLSLRAILGRVAAPCVVASLPVLAGCQYVDRARTVSDAVVGVSQYYKVEALVQADIERRRLRKARCYSPLLTPATISAAATDARLGADWVNELLDDSLPLPFRPDVSSRGQCRIAAASRSSGGGE